MQVYVSLQLAIYAYGKPVRDLVLVTALILFICQVACSENDLDDIV